MDISIRWAIKRDISKILKIDNKIFYNPFSKKELLNFFRRRESISYVMELDRKLIGYLFIAKASSYIHIVRLVIDPEYQKQGYGKTLLTYLCDKYEKQANYQAVIACVDAEDLEANSFFGKFGFFHLSTAEYDCKHIINEYHWPCQEWARNAEAYAKHLEE